MLQQNQLKLKLSKGGPVYGLLNSVPSPLLIEMIGYAGYDFVILDTEHLSVNPESLENMIRAAECAGLTALIRVPNGQPEAITRALDLGAMGVVVPHVCNRTEAEQIVNACRYAPEGMRAIGGGRTTGFGTIDLPTYFKRANQEILVVVMIEDKEGVEKIEEITSVPGIDWVLEGAIDLSQSYGVSGQTQHVLIQQAIVDIAKACQRHSVTFCAIPRDPSQITHWVEQGIKAMLLGQDRGIIFRHLKGYLQQCNKAIATDK
jgi:4-hydroxy-2-oxoheptanedioate aldolase